MVVAGLLLRLLAEVVSLPPSFFSVSLHLSLSLSVSLCLAVSLREQSNKNNAHLRAVRSEEFFPHLQRMALGSRFRVGFSNSESRVSTRANKNIEGTLGEFASQISKIANPEWKILG